MLIAKQFVTILFNLSRCREWLQIAGYLLSERLKTKMKPIHQLSFVQFIDLVLTQVRNMFASANEAIEYKLLFRLIMVDTLE